MRIVLRVEGERIADVEYRDGYNDRGIAERLTRASIPQAIHIVSHICAVDTQAHTLVFCQALEALLKVKVPERAATLRVIAAEVERSIAHLGALIEVLNALGLTREATYLGKLHHGLGEVQQHLCGASVQPNYHVPGGVRQDITSGAREAMLLQLRRLERLMYRFVDRFIDHRGVLQRTVGYGLLGREAAEQFGVRGPIARAAGIPYDARIDRPYAAYATFVPNRVVQERGDVYSRLVVLALEAFESLKLAIKTLSNLPDGEWAGNAPDAVPAGSATATVESARGTLRYTVQSNGVKLTNVRIDAPRQFDRLLARTFLAGMIVDDAALIIASTAPCVACAEQ
jgi:Ni,Fe-hydrogenase III large subunit